MNEKRVYFNKPQRLMQLIGANATVIVAGRRTGKTDILSIFGGLKGIFLIAIECVILWKIQNDGKR